VAFYFERLSFPGKTIHQTTRNERLFRAHFV
jgi:hypothetical protein